MAYLTYTNENGQTLNYQDGGFWNGIKDGTDIYAKPTFINTSVRIEKDWILYDQDIPLKDIQFNVYADGQLISKPVEETTLKAGDRVLDIVNLPYYNQSVNPPVPIVYTVEEIAPDGFTSLIEVEKNLFKFKNILDIRNSFTVTKVWDGGPDKHPDIDIQLYQDGKAYLEPVTLTQGQVTYTWDDLPYGDSTGHVHVYSVDETSILDNYRKSISDDGTTIYNTFLETPIPGDKDDDLVPIIPPIHKPSDKDDDQTPTVPPVHTGDKTNNKPGLPATGVNDFNMIIPLAIIALGSALIRHRNKYNYK